MSAIKAKPYRRELRALHEELVRFQGWVRASRARVLIIVEGRDAAGKGGLIKRLVEPLNPRGLRVVALDKPSERERSQWYFQRYLAHLPAAGDVVVFDRSWYNRAGLEKVMGFCTAQEHALFLRSVPELERMLVDDGLHLRKLYLQVSKAEQARRLEARRRDPLVQWKLSPLDEQAQARWDDYTAAESEMFARTSTGAAPWFVVDADDKRVARLQAIRWVLSTFDYPSKRDDLVAFDPSLVRMVQPKQ